MKSIVILGAGGFAREAYFHLQQSEYENFVFVDDSPVSKELVLNGKRFPVITDWNFSGLDVDSFIIGIGSPRAKSAMTTKAISAGLVPAPTFVHPKALVQDAEIGRGGIVTPGCIVTTNVRIGDFVLLNLNCTVGHDAIVGDFVTANPGCHISGNTTIGAGTTLGTGTVVREKIIIAPSVTTGAQATVVSNLAEAGTYVGVPAKPIRSN